MNIVGKTWFFRQVDDTLEVFHTHFVGAIVGGIGTGMSLSIFFSFETTNKIPGLWATEYGCLAFGITNPGGAIAGNGKQVWLQIVGALFVIGWNIVWTSLIMIFIKYVCRIPLRMSEELLEIGDYAIHGEEPYTFEYYNRSMIEQHGQENQNGNDAEKAMSGSGGSGSGVIVGKDPQLEKPADIHASAHGIGSLVKQD